MTLSIVEKGTRNLKKREIALSRIDLNSNRDKRRYLQGFSEVFCSLFLTQEKKPGIGTDFTPLEICFNFFPKNVFKKNQLLFSKSFHRSSVVASSAISSALSKPVSMRRPKVQQKARTNKNCLK